MQMNQSYKRNNLRGILQLVSLGLVLACSARAGIVTLSDGTSTIDLNFAGALTPCSTTCASVQLTWIISNPSISVADAGVYPGTIDENPEDYSDETSDIPNPSQIVFDLGAFLIPNQSVGSVITTFSSISPGQASSVNQGTYAVLELTNGDYVGVASTPEPAASWLAGFGLVVLAGSRFLSRTRRS